MRIENYEVNYTIRSWDSIQRSAGIVCVNVFPFTEKWARQRS